MKPPCICLEDDSNNECKGAPEIEILPMLKLSL